MNVVPMVGLDFQGIGSFDPMKILKILRFISGSHPKGVISVQRAAVAGRSSDKWRR